MTRARSRKVAAVADDSRGVSDSPQPGAFGTPPSSGKGLYDWQAIDEACRAKPGEWYCVFVGGKRSTATAVRQGSVGLMSAANGYEVRTANNKMKADPPTCDLWVRYVRKNDTKKGGRR